MQESWGFDRFSDCLSFWSLAGFRWKERVLCKGMVWKLWLGGYMTIWLCCIMSSMSSCSESVPSRRVTAYCMFLCFSLQNTNMTLWSHMLYALGSALPCTRTLKVSGTITWEWWVGDCSVLEGQKTFLGGRSCLGPLSCNYDTQNWCYRVGLVPAEKKGIMTKPCCMHNAVV